MRKSFLIKLVIFLCFCVLAPVQTLNAQQTFIKEINYNNLWDLSRTVVALDSTYICFNSVVDFNLDMGHLGANVFDANGDLLHVKTTTILPDYSFTAYSKLKLSDSLIIISGEVATNDSVVAWPFHYAFNHLGDSLWFKTYKYGHGNEGFEKVILAQDGNLLAAGYATVDSFISTPFPTGDTLQAMLQKVDLQGNVIWEHVYPLLNNGELPVGLVELPDGNIEMLIYTSVNNRTNQMLWRLDSLGNIKWQRDLDFTNYIYPHDMLLANDGNLVLCGTSKGSFSSVTTSYVMKVDTAGNTIWRKFFGNVNNYDQFEKIRELPNGDLVAAGTSYRNSGLAQSPDGWLIKLNSQGDTIWERHFNADGNFENYEDDYVWDLDLCKDGGFIMAGMVTRPNTTNSNAWVIKVDSNGNYDLTSDINNNFLATNTALRLYPNPVANLLNIEIERSNVNYPIEVSIYNSLGGNVSTITLQSNAEAIDVAKYSSGLYFVELQLNGRPTYAKFVKN